MADLRVESLFTAIKGLKQERICLEQKLHESKKKSENLERTTDAMKTKLSQIEDTYAKFQETLKVAQHKVAQTQSQVVSCQEQVDLKRTKVQSLNQQIESDLAKYQSETDVFTTHLSHIADTLTDARKRNSLEYVANGMEEYEQDILYAQKSIQESEHNLGELTSVLQELKIEQEKPSDPTPRCGISLEEQRAVFQLFNTKLSSLCERLSASNIRKLALDEDITGMQQLLNNRVKQYQQLQENLVF